MKNTRDTIQKLRRLAENNSNQYEKETALLLAERLEKEQTYTPVWGNWYGRLRPQG